MACKIEEFNISISQFVQNINSNEDKDELANVILNYELLLIEKLDFHLTIHNFYRPFEGFLLDVKVIFLSSKILKSKIINCFIPKTRYPQIENAEILRGHGLEFLDKILNTDAILLYPPSQV